MGHVARQASSQNVADTGTIGAPSFTETLGDTATATATAATDAAASGPSTAAAAGFSETVSDTAADTSPVTTAAPPASETTEQTFTGGGASESTDRASSGSDPSTDSSQRTRTSDGSSSDATQGASDASSSLTSLTDVISSSLTAAEPQLSAAPTSSTTDSALLSTQSSSSTESTTFTPSTSVSLSIDSSSSAATTNSAGTSLTTSFTEIISTIDGHVTTIFSPVATLSADTSSTISTSHRNAIIAGGAVAGTVFILLCLSVVFLCKRHQKRAQARSHRYLPTPRSVMLAGEDDFDLAGPKQPPRGFGIFGSRRKTNAADDYRDIASESGRDLNSPVMREFPSEPPPRLLRPVASKTGSYFQEVVWPPPDEGSQLSDPLMAASNVDLHSIVDEVMGPHNLPGRSSVEVSSTSSLPRPSRLRSEAAETVSLLSEAESSADLVPRVPRHGESPTMSSVGSSFGDTPRHLRDWSADSATALLATMEGSARGARRSSGGGGPWLPPGAAFPSAHLRTASPTSPLRIVTELQQSIYAGSPALSTRARGKANEAAQERRSSLAVANPSPEEYVDTYRGSRLPEEEATSFSVSPTSTHLLRRFMGTMEGGDAPYPDESPIDVRSVPPSLAHAQLIDVNENASAPALEAVSSAERSVREEIPPRYDMIRRDTSTSEAGETATATRTRTS